MGNPRRARISHGDDIVEFPAFDVFQRLPHQIVRGRVDVRDPGIRIRRNHGIGDRTQCRSQALALSGQLARGIAPLVSGQADRNGRQNRRHEREKRQSPDGRPVEVEIQGGGMNPDAPQADDQDSAQTAQQRRAK